MVTLKQYADFDAHHHLYPGVEELFSAIRGQGVDVVAVTRGNQMPFMEEFGNHLESLFDRVHSTLLGSWRSSAEKEAMYPHKRIRPYSGLYAWMTTEDKTKIVIHESLEKFAQAGIRFSDGTELLNAVATYLDSCPFLTDSDLEMWGTCPVIATIALRSPTPKEIADLYGRVIAPLTYVDPTSRGGDRVGAHTDEIIPDFSPNHPAIAEIVRALGTGERFRATTVAPAHVLSL